MAFTVLLVVFVVVMLLWLLTFFGGIDNPKIAAASPILAFIAVLVLGIVIFVGVGPGLVQHY